MSADKSRRWETIYNDLRRQIDQGQLTPGDLIPAEETLAEQYRVSRYTVRTALTRLQQEGVITTGQGRLGRTVREYRPLYWNLHTFERGDRRDDPATGIDEWKADLMDQGVKNARLDISVILRPSPPEIASYLRIQPGEMVLRRRRIRIADDVPVAIADTWVREEVGRREVDGIAPLLVERDVVLSGGIFRALGLAQHEVDDEITVRMPTPEEAELLDLPMGSPVGQVARVGLLEDGEPIRVIITVFPGHRLKLRYRLEV